MVFNCWTSLILHIHTSNIICNIVLPYFLLKMGENRRVLLSTLTFVVVYIVFELQYKSITVLACDPSFFESSSSSSTSNTSPTDPHQSFPLANRFNHPGHTPLRDGSYSHSPGSSSSIHSLGSSSISHSPGSSSSSHSSSSSSGHRKNKG